ncbi:MAG: hypothetical protein WDN31_04990 [Hyphomicrobium sp.]
MADTILLEVATPERRLVHEPVTEAQIPGAEGFLACCRAMRRCWASWAWASWATR